MTLLLGALMTLVMAQQVFDLPLGLGPGLSLENALLYMIAAALAFKIAVQGGTRFELSSLQGCFIALIAYATLSLLAAALIFQYPGYDLLRSVVGLKARWVDQLVFFAVFFYGLRHSRSAISVLKILFVLTIIANVMALLDAYGIVQAAGLIERDDGRIQGVMGESNQSAAYIACFIPGVLAAAMMTRGLPRLLWLAGAVVCAGAMIISASRGALVALFIATVWGLVRFRRYISLRSLLPAIGGTVLILAVASPIIGARYGGLLINRFIGDTASIDPVSASSGRLDIWAGAMARMAETPITFLTGFGWNVYDAMPFRLAPHNHYMALWFDLGLIGVVCGVVLLVLCVRESSEAAHCATPNERPMLIGFAMSTVTISIATFFVDLYTPWLWFWAYAGLVLRIAVNARNQVRVAAPQAVNQPRNSEGIDGFGWSASRIGRSKLQHAPRNQRTS